MASDEEGNKGIKRKSEESAEGSASKHLRPSTSSGIEHVETAEQKVRNLNWMTCLKIDEFGVSKPQCDICNEYHLFYIDSTIFEEHLREECINREKHKEKIAIKKKESSDWIFHFYTAIIMYSPKIMCISCGANFEVQEFKGPFVDHFFKDPEHVKEAMQVIMRYKTKCQRGYEAVDFMSCYMEQCVKYLYRAFGHKVDHDARRKAWWMKHVKNMSLEDGAAVFCGIDFCGIHKFPFKVSLCCHNFQDHVQTHWPGIKLGENANIWDYLSFDNYLLKCQHCDRLLDYNFDSRFIEHLKYEHNIIPGRDGEPRTEIYPENVINDFIKALMQHLIGEYKS